MPGVDVEGMRLRPPIFRRRRASIDAEHGCDRNRRASSRRRFGAGSAGARVGKMVLGTVTVRDGRAYFNGAPLAADANDAVIAACRAVR